MVSTLSSFLISLISVSIVLSESLSVSNEPFSEPSSFSIDEISLSIDENPLSNDPLREKICFSSDENTFV